MNIGRAQLRIGIFASILLALSFLPTLEAKPARKVAILIGGSGKEFKENKLDQDFKNLSSGLRAHGWDSVDILFANPEMVPGSRVPTRQNIFSAFGRFLDELRSGDSLLVMVDGEGDETKEGQTLHSVVIAGSVLNLDDLLPFMKSLSSRGVHLALLDFTCFSGASLRASDQMPDLCTIAASPEHYTAHVPAVLEVQRNSFQDFAYHFTRLSTSREPMSLEMIFFRSRLIDDFGNYPIISSYHMPLSEVVDEFLKNYDPVSFKRTEQLSEPNMACPSCREIDFASPVTAAFRNAVSHGQPLEDDLKTSFQAVLADIPGFFTALKDTEATVAILNPVLSRVVDWKMDDPTVRQIYGGLSLGRMLSLTRLSRKYNGNVETRSIVDPEEKALMAWLSHHLSDTEAMVSDGVRSVNETMSEFDAKSLILRDRGFALIKNIVMFEDQYHKAFPQTSSKSCLTFGL